MDLLYRKDHNSRQLAGLQEIIFKQFSLLTNVLDNALNIYKNPDSSSKDYYVFHRWLTSCPTIWYTNF